MKISSLYRGEYMAYDCLKCKECASMIACSYCDHGSEFVRMSNAEHIRMMNDEELAKFLKKITDDARMMHNWTQKQSVIISGKTG